MGKNWDEERGGGVSRWSKMHFKSFQETEELPIDSTFTRLTSQPKDVTLLEVLWVGRDIFLLRVWRNRMIFWP